MILVLQVFCILATAFLAASLVAVNRRETSPIQKGLNFTGLAAALVICSALIGLWAKDVGSMEVAAQLEGLGQTMFVVSLALFSMRSCGVKTSMSFDVTLLVYMLLDCCLILFLGRENETGVLFYFHRGVWNEEALFGLL